MAAGAAQDGPVTGPSPRPHVSAFLPGVGPWAVHARGSGLRSGAPRTVGCCDQIATRIDTPNATPIDTRIDHRLRSR